MAGPTSIVTALALTLAAFSAPPVKVAVEQRPVLPDITAASWVLYDVTDGVEIAAYRADDERPMASVTKVMSAIVVREHSALDDVVVISENAAATGEAEIGVVPGERWRVYDLLAAAMIRSGNDAVVALAEHAGGSVQGFVDMMNAKAAAMGLRHTHFANPHGLDADDHYSSARDLLEMAKVALDDPVIARLARTKIARFKIDPDGPTRRAVSTNRLLGVFPGVIGMKTGYTGKAGRVLIAVAEREGRTLISVVMGSDDHFADSRELLEYGFATHGLRDRLLTFLFEEEGGGGTTGAADRPSELRLTALEETRIKALPPLPDGRWATSSLGLTTAGDQIEQWLRSISPVLLGGRG